MPTDGTRHCDIVLSVLSRTLFRMAKKQSRRTVSLNRNVFEASKQEAVRRGVPLAVFVEKALAAYGVRVTSSEQRHATRSPSRERQLLGDEVADACGFQ